MSSKGNQCKMNTVQRTHKTYKKREIIFTITAAAEMLA